LFGRQDIYKSTTESAELVGVLICLFKEAELYCVSTNIRLMFEFIQLEIGISTNLYLPAIGTAGLLLLAVKGYNRLPAPPPRITANIDLLTIKPFLVV
jgi:hypothetical protein